MGVRGILDRLYSIGYRMLIRQCRVFTAVTNLGAMDRIFPHVVNHAQIYVARLPAVALMVHGGTVSESWSGSGSSKASENGSAASWSRSSIMIA